MTIEEFNQVSIFLETIYDINIDDYLVKNVIIYEDNLSYVIKLIKGNYILRMLISVTDVKKFFEDWR